MIAGALDTLSLLLPLLASIAYLTLAERKMMGSIQRRVGPNTVGFYGLLQPLSDGLKLLLKERVVPSSSNSSLFVLAPCISLTLSIIAWASIPFAKGIALADLNLALLFVMAVSSLSVYGILLAGWAANSKYAFIGALRSTAQLVSYELPLSLIVLLVVIITGSLSMHRITGLQQHVWLLWSIVPIFLVWVIVIVAETNRAPFDLPEAESELTAGFMTEHSSLPFAFFFLAEYGSILLMSALTSILILGGPSFGAYGAVSYPLAESFALGVKSALILAVFIWLRASLPRVRYDQLIKLCWSSILPLVFSLFVLVCCVLLVSDL
jgi:NADH:ubiquinone oxidoreductase subunit H